MATDKANRQRLSLAEKNENDKQWFKDEAKRLSGTSFSSGSFNGEVSEYKRKKVNYDLVNGIINAADFEYVCQPFGAEVGELPASFTNKDIISGRVKTLLGMEMKRPFSFKVVATNPEATTRKEEEEFGRIREFVVQQIMGPIREEIQLKYQQQLQNKDLTKEEQEQIRKQIQEELEAKTPDKVRKYMERQHQDPAERLSHQLLQYLVQKDDIKRKFNKGWKHGIISGEEVFWVGIVNGEPTVRVVNPVRFDYDKSPDSDFIEDGEWAVAEYRMTPSQVAAVFGSELTNDQLDEIYTTGVHGAEITDADFTFNEYDNDSINTIKVRHCTWKGLRKIGFLTYIDPITGREEEKIVDESYTLDKELGDLEIEWEWIPEVYETYIIGNDIYAYMRPVPGQFKDLDNLYYCKLPYYGGAYDNLNSETTSLVDRMKVYQYYYNIIMYRIELLMASDKGKIMLMNIKGVPRSMGIDLEKFMYYAEALKIGWMNPDEEGMKGTDVTNMAKEIDMSLISDIQKYIELAEYIENMCGKSVGITDAMLGQIAPREAVSNTQTNIAQSSYILEPYFDLHNHIKKNVLQALIEQAKIAYSDYDGKKLSYILDDLSLEAFTIDGELLDNSTLGIFTTNSAKAHEAVELVKQLAQAALQNQAIDLSDVIKVVRTEGIQEAEESLKIAEDKKRRQVNQQRIQEIQEQGKNDDRQRAWEREKMEFERETELLVEEEKTERDLKKQAMMSLGFNEDKDMDDDGTPDILEIYKNGAEAEIKRRKQKLEEEKFQHEKKQDKEENKIKRQQIKNKNNSKT